MMRGEARADGAVFYSELKGLQRALGVQGPLLLPNVRTDAGLYLHHDVAYYLNSNATKYQLIQTSFTPAGAGVTPLETRLTVPSYFIGAQLGFSVAADYTGAYIGAVCGWWPPGVPAALGGTNMMIVAAWPTSTALSSVTYNTADEAIVITSIPVPGATTFGNGRWLPAQSVINFRYRASGAHAGVVYFKAILANTADGDSSIGFNVGSERGEPLR